MHNYTHSLFVQLSLFRKLCTCFITHHLFVLFNNLLSFRYSYYSFVTLLLSDSFLLILENIIIIQSIS